MSAVETDPTDSSASVSRHSAGAVPLRIARSSSARAKPERPRGVRSAPVRPSACATSSRTRAKPGERGPRRDRRPARPRRGRLRDGLRARPEAASVSAAPRERGSRAMKADETTARWRARQAELRAERERLEREHAVPEMPEGSTTK